MKIVIINTDYDAFLDFLYNTEEKKSSPYEIQLKRRNESLFGVADFYSYNLNLLGHEALEIHAERDNSESAAGS